MGVRPRHKLPQILPGLRKIKAEKRIIGHIKAGFCTGKHPMKWNTAQPQSWAAGSPCGTLEQDSITGDSHQHLLDKDPSISSANQGTTSQAFRACKFERSAYG